MRVATELGNPEPHLDNLKWHTAPTDLTNFASDRMAILLELSQPDAAPCAEEIVHPSDYKGHVSALLKGDEHAALVAVLLQSNQADVH
jgi:hypothetical protein